MAKKGKKSKARRPPASVLPSSPEMPPTYREPEQPKESHPVRIVKGVNKFFLSAGFAIVSGLAISALQIAGIISLGVARGLIVLAGTVAAIALLGWVLSRPRKHARLIILSVVLVLLVAVFGLDRWMVYQRAEQDRAAAQAQTVPTIVLPLTKQQTPTPTPIPTPTPERLFIDNPDDVLSRLSKCSRTAPEQICAQPYIGKWMQISGQVYAKYPEIVVGGEHPYIGPIMSISAKRKYPQKYIGAYCEQFAEEWKAHAALSNAREPVTLRGRVIRISISKRFYTIVDCEFVE